MLKSEDKTLFDAYSIRAKLMEDCLIIVDSSGSMYEEGKQAAAEYLLRGMGAFVRDNFPDKSCGVYAWGNTIEKYKPGAPGQRLNQEVLVKFVAEHQDTPMILISDGNISDDPGDPLAPLANKEDFFVVMVGVDADQKRLEKIVGKHRVFDSMDALESIRRLLLR